jgi:hypothetical protein
VWSEPMVHSWFDPVLQSQISTLVPGETLALVTSSYNQMLWMLDPLKGATYPPS